MSFSFRRITITHAGTHTHTHSLAYVFVTFRFSVLDSLILFFSHSLLFFSSPFPLAPFFIYASSNSFISLSTFPTDTFFISFILFLIPKRTTTHTGVHTYTRTQTHTLPLSFCRYVYNFPSAVRFIVVQWGFACSFKTEQHFYHPISVFSESLLGQHRVLKRSIFFIVSVQCSFHSVYCISTKTLLSLTHRRRSIEYSCRCSIVC